MPLPRRDVSADSAWFDWKVVCQFSSALGSRRASSSWMVGGICRGAHEFWQHLMCVFFHYEMLSMVWSHQIPCVLLTDHFLILFHFRQFACCYLCYSSFVCCSYACPPGGIVIQSFATWPRNVLDMQASCASWFGFCYTSPARYVDTILYETELNLTKIAKVYSQHIYSIQVCCHFGPTFFASWVVYWKSMQCFIFS